MKVNNNSTNTTFNGIYNNKTAKSILKFAADNSYLFVGTTALVMGAGVRPLAIMTTPKTDKENRKYAVSKAISSSTLNYLITLAISIPFAKSIKNINNNPKKYLKETTINTLKDNAQNLEKSNAYNFATELFKLGIGILVACPKAILTALGVPVIMDNLIGHEQNKNNYSENFKGKNEKLSRSIGKIINNEKFQKFVKQYKDTNFPLHIMALTDAITTGTFITQIKNNKQIRDERKKPLIYNATLSTALSILSGYTIDKLTNKQTDNFIKKFAEANKNDPYLDKYIKGIKIVKPALILAGVYYIIIPIISTFFAERINTKK